MNLECELVQDFLEMETVVQHPKPIYLLNLSSFEFFCLLYWNTVSQVVDMSLRVLLAVL